MFESYYQRQCAPPAIARARSEPSAMASRFASFTQHPLFSGAGLWL